MEIESYRGLPKTSQQFVNCRQWNVLFHILQEFLIQQHNAFIQIHKKPFRFNLATIQNQIISFLTLLIQFLTMNQPIDHPPAASPHLHHRQLSYRQFYNWTCWITGMLLICSCVSAFWCYFFYQASQVFDTGLGVLTKISYAPVMQWEDGYCVKELERAPTGRLKQERVEGIVLKPSGMVLNSTVTLQEIVDQIKTNNDTQVCYKLNFPSLIISGLSLSKQQITSYYLLSDSLFCLLLLISLLLIHLTGGRLQPPSHRPTIDLYSVQITNLPILPKHILLPSLHSYLRSQISLKYLLQDFPIFDIESSFDELTTKTHVLMRDLEMAEEELRFMEIFNYPEVSRKRALVDGLRLELMEMAGKEQGEQKVARTQCVWVTCWSLVDRWRMLQTFKVNAVTRPFRRVVEKCTNTTQKRFMGKAIKVQKTAQPEQINWQHLYTSKLRKYLTRTILYTLCTLLLIGSNILMLLLQNSATPKPLIPILITLTNLALQQLLTWFSSFQKYKLKTREHSSSMVKLTLCQYVNMGVIMFVNSWRLPKGLALGFLTSQRFERVRTVEWVQEVGVGFVLAMAMQIVVVNGVGVFGPVIWARLREWVHRFRDRRSGVVGLPKPKISEAKLHQSYSSLLSCLLVTLTYCHLLPILYPITLLLFSSHLLCTTLLHLYHPHTHPPAHSDGHLHTTACKLLFFGLCLHFLCVYFTFLTRAHLWVFVALLGIYMVREVMVKYFIKVMRRMKGPICESVVGYFQRQGRYKGIEEVICGRVEEKREEVGSRRRIVKGNLGRVGNTLEDVMWMNRQLELLEELDRKLGEMQPSHQPCLIGRISYSFLGGPHPSN